MIIISRKASEMMVTHKPFWTSHAFESRGLICVARVDTRSVKEGPDGNYVRYMVDLTQEELDEIKNQKEYADLPNPDFCNSVETPRPKGNNPDKKVSSEAEQQKAYDNLQNEGYDEPEFIDKTPWQKGDLVQDD